MTTPDAPAPDLREIEGVLREAKTTLAQAAGPNAKNAGFWKRDVNKAAWMISTVLDWLGRLRAERDEAQPVAWRPDADLLSLLKSNVQASKLPADGDAGSAHLLEMIERMSGFTDLRKFNRWVGYIQGVLVARGCSNLEQMKAMNRGRSGAHPPATSPGAPMLVYEDSQQMVADLAKAEIRAAHEALDRAGVPRDDRSSEADLGLAARINLLQEYRLDEVDDAEAEAAVALSPGAAGDADEPSPEAVKWLAEELRTMSVRAAPEAAARHIICTLRAQQPAPAAEQGARERSLEAALRDMLVYADAGEWRVLPDKIRAALRSDQP